MLSGAVVGRNNAGTWIIWFIEYGEEVVSADATIRDIEERNILIGKIMEASILKECKNGLVVGIGKVTV